MGHKAVWVCDLSSFDAVTLTEIKNINRGNMVVGALDELLALLTGDTSKLRALTRGHRKSLVAEGLVSYAHGPGSHRSLTPIGKALVSKTVNAE